MKVKTDPRILRTRALLQSALLTLMEQKPFRQIYISDITEQAGLARPTFYLHYQSKEELLLGYLDTLFEQYLDQISPQVSFENRGALAVLLFEQLQTNARLIHLIAQMNDETANLILERLQQYIRSVIRLFSQVELEDELHRNLANFATASITGATYAVIIQWVKGGMLYPPQVMGQILNSLLRPGVVNVLVDRMLDDVFTTLPSGKT